MTYRLTSEAAVAAIGNRYDLVLVASYRAKQLHRGARPRVADYKGKHIATALKEIEEGKFTKREYIASIPNKHTKGPKDEYFSA